MSSSGRKSDTISEYSVSSAYENQSVISGTSSFQSSRRRKRRRKKKFGKKEGFVVLDRFSGNDRTPRPLGTLNQHTRIRGKQETGTGKNRSKINMPTSQSSYTGSRPSDLETPSSPTQSNISFDSGGGTLYGYGNNKHRDSLNSLYSGVGSSITPFQTNQSGPVSLSSEFVDEEDDSAFLPSQMNRSINFPGQTAEDGLDNYDDDMETDMPSSTVDQEEEEKLSQEEEHEIYNEDFAIQLKETPTILIFERFQESISEDDASFEGVRKLNERYQKGLEKKSVAPHYFSQKGVQTAAVFRKNKYTDLGNKMMEEKEISVKEYEIYDCYEELQKEKELEEQRLSNMLPESSDNGDNEDKEKDDDDEEDENFFEDDDGGDEDDATSTTTTRTGMGSSGSIFSMKPFQESLMVVERIVVQNENENLIRQYLDLKLIPTPKQLSKALYSTLSSSSTSKGMIDDENIVLQKREGEFRTLWRYYDPMIKDMRVNSICNNPFKSNLFFSAYGSLETINREDNRGYLLCWNLKNIKFPERVFKIEEMTPLCCDFSNHHPNIVSVGFNEGTIKIYDLRNRSDKAILESTQTHSSSIWDIKWVVDKKTPNLEQFFTCGNDGRVKRWSISKGLVGSEIMRLRRTGNQGNSRRFLSRDIGGMTMDFCRDDPNFYLVGTETGEIVKCSTTYNEQYVQVFEGHRGPVYKVSYSPVNSKKFISCSADWTIKVWNEEKMNESSTHSGSFKSSCLEYSVEPYNNIVSSFKSSTKSDKKHSGKNEEIEGEDSESEEDSEKQKKLSEEEEKEGGGEGEEEEEEEETEGEEQNQLKNGKRSYSIVDIEWNPIDDSCFAYCSITGDVHWIDSKFSLYSPRIKKKFNSIPSVLKFVSCSNILHMGDSSGRIHVLKPSYEKKKKMVENNWKL